ncbi:hypothetical protein IC757_05025 [Wenzhouxiangella sp. AB-CW3]|uniref:hypothetical protein n=1 Tax=Wenzhouxiangella sp. AB-CW3 TaxID=2771012 RepID=UPI00168AE20B|nr:hypothetical protein [Wenzhouxiangella sp. AB-CW3]QOC23506.1 hypothetical protein IC757_05025 [Wenzhouxiangella sp. AB-CW3]
MRPLVYSFRRPVHPEADTWVALDASFKQYVYLQGLDAIEISGLDVEQLVDDFAASGTVDEDLGYVQNLDVSLIEAAQEQVANAMQDFIEDQMEDPTTGDVLGGRKAPSVRIVVVSSKIVSKRGRTGADSEVFRRTQKISAGQIVPTT